MTFVKTMQTPAIVEDKKRLWVRFFIHFWLWLWIRVQKMVSLTGVDSIISGPWPSLIQMSAVLSTHSIHGVSVYHAFKTASTERLQQHPFLFTMNCTDCRLFLWRLHLAWPSHPGHSTILLRLESLNGKYTKLHTVAASNNRDHVTRSLYYYLFLPHRYRCHS